MTKPNENLQMVIDIATLDPDRVKKVYSGKPGCGCGCRGKYFEDERNIRRVVKAMRTNLVDAERIDLNDENAAVETETRYYWAYFS